MKSPIQAIKSSSFASGTLVYLVTSIAYAAIPFALLPIMTRYLTPEEYGRVAMFLTLVMGLNAVTGINVHGAASRKYFDAGMNVASMRLFVTSCLFILLLSAVVVALAVFAASNYLSEWLALSTGWLLFAVLVSAMMCLMQIRLGQWQVREQPMSYGLFQICRSVVDLSLSLSLVIWFMANAAGRIWGFGGAAILAGAIALVFLYRDKLVGLRVSTPYIKEAARFGAPLIPHVGGMFLIFAIDRVIINNELGIAAAGIYMVAVQCSRGVELCLASFNRAYVPWLFDKLKRNDEQEKKYVVRLTYGYFLIMVVASALGFVIGPYVVKFVAGPGYDAAARVIGWLVFAQCLRGMYMMVTNYNFYAKRTGVISAITITSGVVNVFLLFVFIDLFGMVGAGIALCCAMSLQFLVTWCCAAKLHPMPWLTALETQ